MIESAVLSEYRKSRTPTFHLDSNGKPFQTCGQAQASLQHARAKVETHEAWAKLGGVIMGEHTYNPVTPTVRLVIKADEVSGVDLPCCDSDTYSHSANPEIPESVLKREHEAEHERINRDGIWGVVGEYWNGEEWIHADSCWGFVGEDWKDSGYDLDIMRATLEAFEAQEHCPTCGRPKEAKEEN